MDAKETVKYLYENGHIMSQEHYKTIYDELVALSIQSKSRFNTWLLAKAKIKKLEAKYDKLDSFNVRTVLRCKKLESLLREIKEEPLAAMKITQTLKGSKR